MVSGADKKPKMSYLLWLSSETTSYTSSLLSQMKVCLKNLEEELHVAWFSLRKYGEEALAAREQLKATNEELSTMIASLEALIRASSSHLTLPSCT